MIERREFIVGVSATAAWSMVAHAQQTDRERRIGVLMNTVIGDSVGTIRIEAFEKALKKIGWRVGDNLKIEYRWAGGEGKLSSRYAEELVTLSPDAIVTVGGFGVGPLLQATKTIPIVFTSVLDPVGAGYVDGLSRPGGNATGFINFEYGIGGKWLDILKQVASSVKRVAVLRDPSLPSGAGQLGSIQTAAASLGLEIRPVDARDARDIEHGLAAFASGPERGLVVTASAPTAVYRDLIIRLAAIHKFPAVYPYRYFARGGGLVSYGPDIAEQWVRAADYVNRILNGEKPANLPVQAPTKYELAINLKTAKALSLPIPNKLLALADEVIE
jgi:putative ABC transport system substrate-binding protein